MSRDDSETLDTQAAKRYQALETSRVRRVYRVVATLLKFNALGAQRLKALYFMPGYWKVLFVRQLPFSQRLGLILKFLRVDWNIVHGHRPAEIAHVTSAAAARGALSNEVMVEAGCWRGGSTAKFSIICATMGLRLHVFDSFEGVEHLDAVNAIGDWNFGGQYACADEIVRDNVRRFGDVSVCEFHKGWFSETLAAKPVGLPVKLAYIDCDLAKGTMEALQGVMPNLTADGIVFSQDFHIAPVRKLLLDRTTWAALGVGAPEISPLSVYMVQLSWPQRGGQ